MDKPEELVPSPAREHVHAPAVQSAIQEDKQGSQGDMSRSQGDMRGPSESHDVTTMLTVQKKESWSSAKHHATKAPDFDDDIYTPTKAHSGNSKSEKKPQGGDDGGQNGIYEDAISPKSAFARFLTRRYLWCCRVPAGYLDRQMEHWANTEIMYTSEESTVLALVHERRYTAILVILGIVMMLFSIPGIVAAVVHVEHTVTQLRFTTLALQGLPPTTTGIQSFGLRRGGCRLATPAKHNITFIGTSAVLTFQEEQTMDGWYIVTPDASPHLYPVRFSLEASSDGNTWQTVGASSWTCVNGWHEFDSSIEARGTPHDWDLLPSFPWVLSQVAVPLASGVALTVGALLGRHDKYVFSAQFIVVFGTFCTAVISGWSAIQLDHISSTDSVVMVDAAILAIGRASMLLTVYVRSHFAHEWISTCGGCMLAANVLYQIVSAQRFMPRFVWLDSVVGLLVLGASLLTRAHKIVSAYRLVAPDQALYEEEWQRVRGEEHASLQALETTVNGWSKLCAGVPMQRNAKVEKMLPASRENSIGESGQSDNNWMGTMLELKSFVAIDKGARVAAQLDASSPVTSLDQVCVYVCV
jgi:hypothetical protein